VLITFYGNVIVLPLAFIPTLFVWTTPSLEQMGWITALGVTNTLNQIVLARAITAADSRIVWPFDFLRLPFAVLQGYFMFAELPGPWTWVGAVIIFASSYYIVQRETRAKAGGGA